MANGPLDLNEKKTYSLNKVFCLKLLVEQNI